MTIDINEYTAILNRSIQLNYAAYFESPEQAYKQFTGPGSDLRDIYTVYSIPSVNDEKFLASFDKAEENYIKKAQIALNFYISQNIIKDEQLLPMVPGKIGEREKTLVKALEDLEKSGELEKKLQSIEATKNSPGFSAKALQDVRDIISVAEFVSFPDNDIHILKRTITNPVLKLKLFLQDESKSFELNEDINDWEFSLALQKKRADIQKFLHDNVSLTGVSIDVSSRADPKMNQAITEFFGNSQVQIILNELTNDKKLRQDLENVQHLLKNPAKRKELENNPQTARLVKIHDIQNLKRFWEVYEPLTDKMQQIDNALDKQRKKFTGLIVSAKHVQTINTSQRDFPDISPSTAKSGQLASVDLERQITLLSNFYGTYSPTQIMDKLIWTNKGGFYDDADSLTSADQQFLANNGPAMIEALKLYKLHLTAQESAAKTPLEVITEQDKKLIEFKRLFIRDPDSVLAHSLIIFPFEKQLKNLRLDGKTDIPAGSAAYITARMARAVAVHNTELKNKDFIDHLLKETGWDEQTVKDLPDGELNADTIKLMAALDSYKGTEPLKISIPGGKSVDLNTAQKILFSRAKDFTPEQILGLQICIHTSPKGTEFSNPDSINEKLTNKESLANEHAFKKALETPGTVEFLNKLLVDNEILDNKGQPAVIKFDTGDLDQSNGLTNKNLLTAYDLLDKLEEKTGNPKELYDPLYNTRKRAILNRNKPEFTNEIRGAYICVLNAGENPAIFKNSFEAMKSLPLLEAKKLVSDTIDKKLFDNIPAFNPKKDILKGDNADYIASVKAILDQRTGLTQKLSSLPASVYKACAIEPSAYLQDIDNTLNQPGNEQIKNLVTEHQIKVFIDSIDAAKMQLDKAELEKLQPPQRLEKLRSLIPKAEAEKMLLQGIVNASQLAQQTKGEVLHINPLDMARIVLSIQPDSFKNMPPEVRVGVLIYSTQDPSALEKIKSALPSDSKDIIKQLETIQRLENAVSQSHDTKIALRKAGYKAPGSEPEAPKPKADSNAVVVNKTDPAPAATQTAAVAAAPKPVDPAPAATQTTGAPAASPPKPAEAPPQTDPNTANKPLTQTFNRGVTVVDVSRTSFALTVQAFASNAADIAERNTAMVGTVTQNPQPLPTPAP